MIHIRRARAADSGALTDLAARSEAHWGFDEAFLARFRELYAVTAGFIEAHPTFLAEEDDRVLGFYALVEEAGAIELEYLYVDPAAFGQGLGRDLWEHMASQCRERRIGEVHLVCGPEPKAFYLRMGAREVGSTESKVVPGRTVYRMSARIGAQP